jgi:hypothetical protein
MKLTSVRRTALAGAAALTLVGASLGVVAAQQAPTASPVPGAPAAPGQGTPGQQRVDRQQRQQQFLAAVAAKLGISLDQLQQAMDQTRTELGIPERGPGGGGDRRMGGGLDAAAQALGINVDQLRQELRGKTLTQVAQAHNVDPTTVANALKTAANDRIDQEAAAGRIPADQVVAAKQRAAERIDQMMTQTGPAGRPAQKGPDGRSARTGTPGTSR